MKNSPPLNQWLEEEREISVMEPQINPKTEKVEFKQTTRKVQEKVYYAGGKHRVFMCTDHIFEPDDPKKYTFKCQRCSYHFKGYPPSHRYDPETRKLYNRKTGELLRN